MATGSSGKYPAERKVQGLGASAENLHSGFFAKKMKVNESEVPQYYVDHSHPAIILPEEWEKIQPELARRKKRQKDCVQQSLFHETDLWRF